MRAVNTSDVLDVSKLDDALYSVADTLQRCSIKFVLLGDTAFSIYHNLLPKYNKINLGVKKQELSQFALSMLPVFIPGIEIGDHKIKFDYQGIPVEIRIIYKDYPFFDNPQTITFKFDDYLLPNPFDKYWKVYRLIQ